MALYGSQIATELRARHSGRGELRMEFSNRAIQDLAREIELGYVAETKVKMADALARFALLIEQEAVALCPVDTGNLQASIQTALEEASALIFTDVTYAAFVEFGTSRMPARPFMRQAFERYSEELYLELKKIAEGQ